MRNLLLAFMLTLAAASPAAAQGTPDQPPLTPAERDTIFEGAAVDELLEALKTIVFIEQIDRSCGIFADIRPRLPELRSELYDKFNAQVQGGRDFIQSQISVSERYYREQIQGVVLSGCSGSNFERGVAELRRDYRLMVDPPSGDDVAPIAKARAYYDECAASDCSVSDNPQACLRACACSAHRLRRAMTEADLDVMMFEFTAQNMQRQSPEFHPDFRHLPPEQRPKELPPASPEEVRAANAARNALIAGPLLDVAEGCEADVATGYGRDG